MSIHSLIARLFLCPISLSLCSYNSAADFPGEQWRKGTPSEAGLDEAKLTQARDYALTGGGSGCIVRGGKLVFAWGGQTQRYDLKSSTKSFGAAALGIAIKDGKMQLSDKARTHHPSLGIPPDSNTSTGWIDDITILHLAVQTAGFAKPGGYVPLLFKPGTEWSYSDSGPNWLAECITLAYQRDLDELMFERVFAPLGITRADLSWRKNSYRPDHIDGIKRREFGAGISANVNAMARFGLLWLRGGEWNGAQLLPRDFVDKVRTTVSGVPGLTVHLPEQYGRASNHYGLLWWNNADETIEGVPVDAYWTWGLYDSLIVVIPSLDLVVARAGKSWQRTKNADHYDVLKPFLLPIVAAAGANPAPKEFSAQSATPYTPSALIRDIEWAPKETIIRQAKGSDNWPITWAADDALYTAYGDGNGFEPFLNRKLGLGLAKVTGIPPDIRGVNIRSETAEALGDGKQGRKASGMLSIDGVLYLLARNTGNAQLGWSTDYGATWSWADWKFTESFGCPTFLNFGKDYAGARDEHVYIYSHDSDSAYDRADRFVMARVPKDKMRNRDAYEFFETLTPDGRPRWDQNIARRGAIFISPGACYRSSVSYNAGLKRYLWCQIGTGSDTRYAGGFAIYDAPEPWGPWTTAFHTNGWDVGPGESNSLPTKWMSTDGQTIHLVFSGDDHFSVRKGTILLREPSRSADLAGKASTKIALHDGRWMINGHLTNQGSVAEGLLMNVRMVNATFEDLNKPDFDPEANTDRFIAKIGEYAEQGVNAFTFCLQGGMPGYEGAVNSAFESDGGLRPSYLKRIERVIRACDQHGIAVILSLFYQRQSSVLADERAVRNAVVNAVRWVRERGFPNVMIEIANEYPHKGFVHAVIRDPKGQAGLIRLAKETAPELLVSASGYGDGKVHAEVAEAADFLLPHWNGVPVEQIPARLQELKRFGKPIVCNEDDKTGEAAVTAMQASVNGGASYGLMLQQHNQTFPFQFDGQADDSRYYSALKAITLTPKDDE